MNSSKVWKLRFSGHPKSGIRPALMAMESARVVHDELGWMSVPRRTLTAMRVSYTVIRVLNGMEAPQSMLGKNV